MSFGFLDALVDGRSQLRVLKPPEAFSVDLRDQPEYCLKRERKLGIACSTSGRSGSRLPQMHAARISIRDHLMTSTLSQVESYVLAYFNMNLSRIMLVMDALELLSVFVRDIDRERPTKIRH